jgi:glycosyltransferase involved in cell wall biosynthesis
VLFVDNPFSRPTDGGGYTYQQLLLAGLKRMHSRHECSYVQPEAHKGVVKALVQRNQVDFVWFMSLYCEPVPVPFATTVWDLGHREMPWFPELSLSGWTFEQREQHYREVLPRASLIAVGNSVGARAIQEFYRIPADRIREIALPVDASALAAEEPDAAAVQALGLVPGEYLLYPAQFWPHKNHITLVDMLALLQAAGRPLKLVFSGSDKGNRGYVEQYVRQRGLQERVLFTGFIDTALLHQLYRHAFAMVFGSVMGPDNLPPLEAMALGCPVVCAAFAGAREQLGEAALLFAPLDPAAAASCVAQLEDPALRQRLCERGREVVASRSPDDYIRRINEALDGFAVQRRLWGPGDSYRHPA